MAMQGRTDTLASKPKFPKERTQKGTVSLVLGNTATFPTSTLIIASASVNGVANGWVASVANIGNTTGTIGFNLIGPTVSNVQSNTITLNRAVGNNIPVGSTIIFSRPKSTANVSDQQANNYNANTYLISSSRMINANSILQTTSLVGKSNANTVSPIAHTGWVLVTPQTGYVKSITANVSGNQAANGFITFTANTLYPGGSGANATYEVDANGKVIAVTLVSNGANYVVTPAATAPFSGIAANAVNATFTVVMGGRANRVQTEVLSVVANTLVSDTASGGIWFPGR